MKHTFCLFAGWLACVAGLAVSVSAADYPPAYALLTVSATNSFSNYTTNLAAYSESQTNDIEFASYHTFHAVFASTNDGSLILDRSLDGVNWVSVSTNSFTTPGGVVEQTMTGKWRYARLNVAGTNCAATIYYLGARQ